MVLHILILGVRSSENCHATICFNRSKSKRLGLLQMSVYLKTRYFCRCVMFVSPSYRIMTEVTGQLKVCAVSFYTGTGTVISCPVRNFSHHTGWSRAVVPKVVCTAPWGGIGITYGALRGKEAAGGDGDGPLGARCPPIYDWSDFIPDTGKLVSLHQAYPSH
jgi:hypothetical protein